MYKYLIQFLVLVSASLSLHSALALPLSSQLASKYHAVSQSNKSINNLNNLAALNHFNFQQQPQLALVNKLLLLQKEKRDDNLCFQALMNQVITDDIQHHQQVAQSQVKHSLQKLCKAHLGILAYQNTSYSKKNCYQAKRQQQSVNSKASTAKSILIKIYSSP